MGFLGIVILFLFAFASCQAYKIPESNNPKMIDFAGVSSTEQKIALATLLSLLPGVDPRDEAKEVMNYQKCYNVIEFVSMTDANIESFTLRKKEGKELVQQLLPMTVISWIKQLKNFTSHLMTDSDQTVLSAIITAMFETWVLQQMHIKDVPNDARRMEAIDKFNIKDLNPFNGSTVDWPGTFRKTTQIIKNWGMGDHLDSTVTPPGVNTHAHKLWDKQNTFLKTALTARWTGGQASVIIRQHDSAQTIFKEIKDHYNSASNKSASITLTMSKMTRLVFDDQSNVSLITHLKTMQDYAADLEDCGNKLDEAHFKSLLCSSIRHSAFENMIDGFLSSAIKPPAMITELTHKANRMIKEVPSKRNINFQKSNKNDKDKKIKDKDDNKKTSKWRVAAVDKFISTEHHCHGSNLYCSQQQW